MGALGKVVDLILLLTFLAISVVAPFLDSQTFLPQSMFPDFLVRFYKWYAIENQDYLLLEKPHFFIALMKLELFFVWPLALLNIYGLLTSKPWFNTSCLIFGAALITSTTAMVGDMIGSQKPSSDKLVMMYSPFIAFGALAVLRGLVSQCKASTSIRNGPTLVTKKRA
ncbi:sigma intracellular receptor 2-like [Durio zibethinus]|uniref:Sigma intracellular receptor 2-like n=1 Tax=Durio zibethinus TaxID=66656 RepID=A0A6P6BF59_DURZI|nr:sigma intracellular receptor 2-like [Durio zibethinus]